MHWKAIILPVLALLVEHGSTQDPRYPMLRFECSQLIIDRLDPLVNPGLVPSPHLHQIVGGNSFNASMPAGTHDLPSLSTCTSCTFSEDFSNYWTAVLYFRARNGTYRRVPQFVSSMLNGNGGITVYYIPSYAGLNVTAFKPGFRMLVGDASLRRAGSDPKVCHRCMPETGEGTGVNCGPPDSQELPKDFCPGGIRSVITFPTCWDGVNLDSDDHESHVAYPVKDFEPNHVGANANCPASHPVTIPQVMYEVMWDTRIFNDRDLWPLDGSQPFSWSTGDTQGYSQHGDYVFGWKDDSLQRAMDHRCTGNTCEVLKVQSDEEAMKCTKAPVYEQQNDGYVTHIPGQQAPVA